MAKNDSSFRIELDTQIVQMTSVNWPGQIYKVSRASLAAAATIAEMRGPGIYILLTDTQPPTVYIGKSNNVFERLKQHDKDKYKGNWQQAIAVVAITGVLNESKALFLEQFFYDMAKQENRCVLINSNRPAGDLLHGLVLAMALDFGAKALLLLICRLHLSFLGDAQKALEAKEADAFVAGAGKNDLTPQEKEEKAPQARYNAIMPLELYNRIMAEVIPTLPSEVNPNNGKVRKSNLSMYLRNLVIADLARHDAEKK